MTTFKRFSPAAPTTTTAQLIDANIKLETVLSETSPTGPFGFGRNHRFLDAQLEFECNCAVIADRNNLKRIAVSESFGCRFGPGVTAAQVWGHLSEMVNDGVQGAEDRQVR